MKKNILIITVVILVAFFVACFFLCNDDEAKEPGIRKVNVDSFEKCVEIGNPVMESYPRQCRNGNDLFVEEIDDRLGGVSSISKEKAFELAGASDECKKVGELSENTNYNPMSKTWWIDLDMHPEAEKKGCSPACVVNDENFSIEVNWRCTGLIRE